MKFSNVKFSDFLLHYFLQICILAQFTRWLLSQILQRLISALARCALCTCCLPLEIVELMPFHSRFSLTCLQKLFLCSISQLENRDCNYGISDRNLARSEVFKVSIMILMSRCNFIFLELGFVIKRLLCLYVVCSICIMFESLHSICRSEFLASSNGGRSYSFSPKACPYCISSGKNILSSLYHHSKESVFKENLRRYSHLLVLFPNFVNLLSQDIQWSLDANAANATVLVGSEAHATTLAIEGPLEVDFAFATLTDEAVDDDEKMRMIYWWLWSMLMISTKSRNTQRQSFPQVQTLQSKCNLRDDLDGTLWRLAVDGFHRILTDYVRKLNPPFGTDLTIA